MELIDFRFLGHQRPLPLMTPGGLDPSDTIISTTLLISNLFNGLRLHQFLGTCLPQ